MKKHSRRGVALETRRIRSVSKCSLTRSLLVVLLCITVSFSFAEKNSRHSVALPSVVAGNENKLKNRDIEDDSSAVVVVSDVLQITETEVWDGGKWKSGDSRWTTTSTTQASSSVGSAASIKDGRPCASPDKQQPPEGFKFDGEWKIVTGGSSRDSYGWEYTAAKPFPIRQRVWLRNLVQEEPKPKKEILKIKRKPSSAKLARKSRRRKMPKWMRAISDDFNFKGFGLSLYKSMVFPKSFGIAFRLPLTYNFGRWETNPGLPSLSSAIGIYFPGMAMISISTSVRIEWLKWVSARIVEISFYLLLAFFWTFIRGLVLACSAILFPFTRQLYQPPIPMASPWARPSSPSYSRIIEERLGCSVSWRVSRSSGYEFRVSYWHYYAHTLSSIWPAVEGVLSILQRQNKATMPDWWARRSAAFGLSTSWPIPDAPHITSSLTMSLSGYYFRPVQKVRLVTSTVIPTKTTVSPRQEEERSSDTIIRSSSPKAKASFVDEAEIHETSEDLETAKIKKA